MWCKVCLRHLGTKFKAHESCAQQPDSSSEHTKTHLPFVRASLNRCSQCHCATPCFVNTENMSVLESVLLRFTPVVFVLRHDMIRPHTTPRYSQYGDTFRLIPRHRETLCRRVLSVDCIVMCVAGSLRNTCLISLRVV